MSGQTFPDAGVPDPGAGGGLASGFAAHPPQSPIDSHLSSHQSRSTSSATRSARWSVRVARRWWVIAVCVALALVVAGAYLAIATPVYRASVLLASGYGANATGTIPPDEFLAAQRAVILSAEVIAAGLRAAPQLTDLRSAMRVRTSKGDGSIMVSVEASDPEQTARAANALAEAYLEARGGKHAIAAKGLTELSRTREQRTAERDAAEKALADFRASTGTASTEGDKVAAARLKQLFAALSAAELEAANAKAASAAAPAMSDDAKRAAAVIESNRPSGIFAGLDQQRAQVAEELRQLEAQHERQRQTMLAQHPVVVATQRRIDTLKAQRDTFDAKYADVYRAYLEQQLRSAQRKVLEMQILVTEQQGLTKTSAANAVRMAELESALKQADAAAGEADKKLRDAMLDADASGLEVKLAQPAQPPRRPVRPDRSTVLLLAIALGAGVGLCIVTLASRRFKERGDAPR
ncbi:MAG: Wzz/FepE/Etk N-terminal domain-containing protein [Tepidisphaeraceae bacterium]